MRATLVLASVMIGLAGCSGLPLSEEALADFENRAQSCEHWSGEDAYDEARGAEIARALKLDRCATLLTDAEHLRAANRSNPPVVARIDAAVSPFY